MSKFCKYCGRPLGDNEICSCTGVNPDVQTVEGYSAQPAYYNTGYQTNIPGAQQNVIGFWENIKNRIGIGNPELNHGDVFERGKKIVPDCISASEGEVPVKQYTVAKLRSRILGIPYRTALGSLQVTNKRVIFRAPGKCIAGRTTLQQDFAIDEIAGIEARREYAFNFWDFLLAIFVHLLGGLIAGIIINLIGNGFYSRSDDAIWFVFMSAAIGIGCYFAFFRMFKKWLLKVLCLGAGLSALVSMGIILERCGVREYYDWYSGSYYSEGSEFYSIWSVFCYIAAVAVWVLLIVSIFIYCIRPNLVLSIKTKSAIDAIVIKRQAVKINQLVGGDHTGYTEILPEKDAESSIRELSAIIGDIQKLGDFGIEKWKEQ